MTADREEQEDELLALRSILDPEEFVQDESKAAGEIRVSVELPSNFTVALNEGETLSQYEISFLPPLLLTFELPEDYPSSSPPSFSLTCSWLTHTQLSVLAAQLKDLFHATGGTVVLFTWIQFVKEDALKFLDIHTFLELPSDKHTTQNYSQQSLHAALSEPRNNRYTSESGPSDNQSLNVSAPSLDVENPTVSLADGQDPLTSGSSSKDSQGAVASEPCKARRNNSASHHSSQNDPNSRPNADDQETFSASEQTPREETEAEGDQTQSFLSLTQSQILLSQLLINDAAQKEKQFATTVFDCGVCFMSLLGSDCVQLPECSHIFCRTCFGHFCELQIKEGNVLAVTCLQADCTATPTPAQVKSLVGEELFSRYDRLLLQKTLDLMPDVVYCPRNTCGSVVIKENSSTAAMCSVCGFAFCVTCRKTYHGADDCPREKIVVKQKKNTQEAFVSLPKTEEKMKALWDDYDAGTKKRRKILESRYGLTALQSTVASVLSDDWIAVNSKNCPYCFTNIEKDGGCNVMTCSRCRRPFCWVCLTKLLMRDGYRHFNESTCPSYST